MTANEIQDLETTAAETAVIDEPVASVEEASAPVKRITKRGWVTLAASAGALVIAAAIATPIIANNIAYGNAIDALTASEAAVEDAHAELVTAYEDKHLVISEVPAVYAESGELAGIARAELIANAATVETLQEARAELLEVSGVTVDGEDITVPEAEVADPVETTAQPSSIEAILEQTERNEKLAASLAVDAATAQAEAAAVEDAIEDVNEGMEGVVESGAEFGAGFTGFEKGSDDARKALTASVDALSGDEGTLLERFQAYVTAFNGLKKSHDDVVAAEKAAAEEAARKAAEEEARRNGGGSYSNGGGNRGGSSGGGSYNGGGSTGGNTGGSTGGNSGGSAAPAPQQPPAPAPAPKVPATFIKGSMYVPYSGRCSFHNAHQVGWGGTSTGAYTLDTLGVHWSATVNGDTVTYYICD